MKKQLLIMTIISISFLTAAPRVAQALTPHNAQAIENKQCALRQAMRKLWTDHVVWTRDYIIAAIAGTPDAQAASVRLLKNQEDIGNAIAGYYGAPAGAQLTGLLKEHILVAVDLINAAKANDQVKFNAVNAKWKLNGQQIADFLAAANPNWPQATMRQMMDMHLTTTIAEVTARLQKKYDEEVRAYDLVYDHILAMSDALSDGIIKQFPNKF
ncbi:MAG TPA: glycosyltransferase [bacterium]|nr:glycosyltransferase [bacterium]